MSISRRNFIKIGSVSAALLAGNCLGLENNVFGQSKLSGGSLSPEVYSDSLFSYHAETFKKLVGSPFTLYTENSAETVVLVKIREGSTVSKKALASAKIRSTEEFMLSFRVSSTELPQANYRVFHPELGHFDLLLVPAKNDKGENMLNAIINRL